MNAHRSAASRTGTRELRETASVTSDSVMQSAKCVSEKASEWILPELHARTTPLCSGVQTFPLRDNIGGEETSSGQQLRINRLRQHKHLYLQDPFMISRHIPSFRT